MNVIFIRITLFWCVIVPGYATHFFFGFLLALVFFYWDEKDRMKTLVLGGFAGVIPDIDGIWEIIIIETGNPTLDYLFSHRGFWHNPILPSIFALAAILYVGVIFLLRRNVAKDHFLTLAAIALAWYSHLILDFGFTAPAQIYEIPLILVYALDQLSAFSISLLFGYILWTRVN